MTADQWAQGVRQQLGLGRILPLGDPRDGAWISEKAAGAVLRRAVDGLRGVRVTALRIGLADPEDTHEPAVPPPASALPPGPLRVTAELAAIASEPLPTAAARVRAALADTAAERLGLAVTEVDLRVTALLDEEPQLAAVRPPESAPAAGAAGAENALGNAALTVQGVVRVTRSHVEERAERPEEAALPRRHVLLELAVGADHRALDVAREVRVKVSEAVPDHPTVAVLVTAVG